MNEFLNFLNEFLNFLIPTSIEGFIFEFILLIYPIYAIIMMLLNFNKYKYSLLLIFILFLAFFGYVFYFYSLRENQNFIPGDISGFFFFLYFIALSASISVIYFLNMGINTIINKYAINNTKNNYNTNKSKYNT